MKILVVPGLLLSAALFAQGPAASSAAAPLDEVLKLIEAKVPDNMILKMLARQAKALDISASDLIRLQKAGASERIMEALLDPAQSTPPAPAAPAPAIAPTTRLQPEAPAAEEEQPKKPGIFGRVKDRAKSTVRRTGQRAVDNAEQTANSTMDRAEKSATNSLDSASAKADAGVQNRLDNTQKRIDNKVEKATGASKR